jgi:hypothetical protein
MSGKTLIIVTLVSATSALGIGLGNPTISAQAGDFYTRKRVNGVWMTGRFPRHHAIRTAQLETKAPLPLAEPPRKTIAIVTPASDDLAPAFQRAFEARRAMAAMAAPIAASAVPVPSKAAAPATPAAATAAAPVLISDNQRLLPLRKALEERAKLMAVSTTSSSRNIKAVTFNFETGLRTSIYNDGSVVEEHFDPDTTLTGSIKY